MHFTTTKCRVFTSFLQTFTKIWAFSPKTILRGILFPTTIHEFTCVSSSTNAPIVDHLQDTLDVSPTTDNEEDKLFIEDPLDLSFAFSGNIDDEFFNFSSTPPFNLSDHEDANEIIYFSDCSFRDLFSPIFDHDHDPITVDFSKPHVYDDLFDDEVETP